jgi:hypothetical protein
MTRDDHKSAANFMGARRGSLLALAIVLLGGWLLVGGCAAPNPPASVDKPAAANSIAPAPATDSPATGSAAAGPQVVTDLSQLSDADTSKLAPAPFVRPTPTPTYAELHASKNEVLTQQLAANAPSTRYDYRPSKDRGGSRLLNDKARQYAEFAELLLNQTLHAAQTMAPDKLSQHRVPYDLKPTTLTAVMDADGRLREIIIEQHSGDLAVDKLFIEACKTGIWSRNPPPGARASDGSYRVRIEGTIYNSTYDRYGEYSYDTELGLGIL